MRRREAASNDGRSEEGRRPRLRRAGASAATNGSGWADGRVWLKAGNSSEGTSGFAAAARCAKARQDSHSLSTGCFFCSAGAGSWARCPISCHAAPCCASNISSGRTKDRTSLRIAGGLCRTGAESAAARGRKRKLGTALPGRSASCRCRMSAPGPLRCICHQRTLASRTGATRAGFYHCTTMRSPRPPTPRGATNARAAHQE